MAVIDAVGVPPYEHLHSTYGRSMPHQRLSKEQARAAMAQFVADYQRQSADLERVNSRYTEAEVRGEFIDRFLRIFGWDVHNDAGLPQVRREVVLERGSESDIGGRPDYRLRRNGQDRLPIEAKKPSVKLSTGADAARQARSYGWSLKVPAAVLINVAETVIYDTTVEPREGDSPDVAVIPGGRITLSEYLDRFDYLWLHLSFESVSSDGYYDLYSYVEPPRGTSTFDRSFLTQFRNWRLALASDIAFCNPDLPAAEVGRRTQRLLNALLFLRVCEDRNIGQYETLLTSAQSDGLLSVFRSADRTFNAGLFDVLNTTKFTGVALTSVINEMYWPRSKFAFGVLRPDILAAVYEQYLAERVEFDDRGRVSLAQKPELTHAGGVVPTPAWVVQHLVAGGLNGLLVPQQPASVDLRILDLTLGSGSFLIEVFERLVDAEVAAGNDVGLAERSALVKDHLFGVDIDGAAVEVTKLSLLLAVLGDEVVDLDRGRNLLPDLSKNLLVGNALIESDFDNLVPSAAVIPERRAAVAPLNLTSAFTQVLQNGGFNLIVGNPPYVRIQTLSEFMPDQLAYFQDARSGYESALSHNFDLYQLVVERAFKLLAADGYLAYILPNRFTNLVPAGTIRGLLGPRLLRLVHFGEEQVFEGRTTYTALIFIGPPSSGPAQLELVRDLHAWHESGSSELAQIDRSSLGAEVWPIMSEARANVFRKMDESAIARLCDDDWVNVFVGVQTSCDKVFFIKPLPESTGEIVKFRDPGTGQLNEIERGILRKAVQDRRFQPYGRNPEPDALVIFPYEVVPPTPGRKRGTATVYSAERMAADFPMALEYLTSKHADLGARDVSPDPGDRFWAYGRSQSLTKLDEPKLILRVLSLTPQYVLDDEGLVAPGGGDGGPYYFLRPTQNCPYSIRVIQAVLSHPAVDAYIASRGRAYRGSYLVHRKEFIKNVPIPMLSDAAQQQIENDIAEMQDIQKRLRTEQDTTIRTTLAGRHEVLRQQVNEAVAAGYGLMADDSLAIADD
ncbi:hypothetical protein AO501_25010 [Mycobacterium gordonae]|uniref:site-specific DNA-methyltransferase (adenine-specific) n=1 Tax=Mycobacterium gordonae TaxID=1778 RepID=A0A0Q2RJF3_MYCGO|nr:MULTISPECIES: DNA methyltransferase [Mycobacterium]KQH75547.1 hypothetical protein AO501_25010 [Mycobacterium gordonae]MDP7732143.1 Eco57I restriction-modification methylase domain-containing protein [Mycobacterium sp. TY813]